MLYNSRGRETKIRCKRLRIATSCDCITEGPTVNERQRVSTLHVRCLIPQIIFSTWVVMFSLKDMSASGRDHDLQR